MFNYLLIFISSRERRGRKLNCSDLHLDSILFSMPSWLRAASSDLYFVGRQGGRKHQPHQQLVVRNFEVPCSSVDEIVLHPRSIGTWDTWQRRIHNDLKEVLRNLPRDENVICQAISLRNDEQLCWRGDRICTPFYLTWKQKKRAWWRMFQASTKTHGKIQLAAAPESKVDSVKKDLQEGVANDRHRRSGSSFSRHRE